jgi:predicted amidophosphoribosyltransferase
MKKKVTLEDIVNEYGKHFDDEARRRIEERHKAFMKQARELRRELKRAGKIRSNFRNKKQYRQVVKLAAMQGKTQ